LENARKSLHQIAMDTVARPELLIFGCHDWFIGRYNRLTELLLQAREDRRREDGHDEDLYELLAQNVVPMAQVGLRALMYLVVAYKPNYFDMPLSQLNFVENAIRDIFASITSLQWKLGESIIHDMFRVRNLFECADYKSNYSIPADPKPYVSNTRGMKIEVKDMTFRYGKKSDPVLEDINFTIEPGQIVSIVGYNGSGKIVIVAAYYRKIDADSAADAFGKTDKRGYLYQ
jgi:ABC-type multidrug transport system fused ATPase/permease subunit